MEVHNKIGKLIIVGFIAMLMAFSLFGCGTRKTEKSKTVITETAKVETSTIDSSKTVTVTDTNTKIVDSSSSEEFTISPIDSTKEMIVNKVVYINAVLKRKKTSNNKVVVKSENVTQTAQNNIKTASKSETKNTAVIEVKNTERKSGFPWWIIILILIGSTLFFIYRHWKKLPPF